MASVTLAADTVIKLRSATRRTPQLANQLLALLRADALGGAEQLGLAIADQIARMHETQLLHSDASGIDNARQRTTRRVGSVGHAGVVAGKPPHRRLKRAWVL